MTEWSDPSVVATALAGGAGVMATIGAAILQWRKTYPAKPTDAASPQIAVGIVQREKDVILVRRSEAEGPVLWQFPAGMINPKRSGDTTIVKEVLEETGIRCKVTREIGRRVHPNTKRLCVYFHCIYEDGDLSNGDSKENAEVKWVRGREAPKLITSDLYPPVLDLLRTIDA